MPEMSSYETGLASLLKAEVVCAELVQRGLPFDKIRYTPQSAFKKSYRSDIDKIINSDDSIEIIVNRDGVYDRLPEGLFHQTRGNTGSNVAEMVAEHKRYKEEEKAARRFFSPFEQEFFRYGLMVEQEERRITGSLFDEKMIRLFRDFWGLDDDLPLQAVSVFIRTLPWLSVVKGERELTAQTLSAMLGMPVSVEETVLTECLRGQSKFILGENTLGTDTMAGANVSLPLVIWRFTINDVLPGQIELFTEGKPYDLFLKKFEDYFIPLDVDAVFEYETQTFTGQDQQYEAVLGYSLTL